MKTLRYIAAAVVAAGFMAAPANATVFMFKSGGAIPTDNPIDNIAFDCGTTGSDFCTDVDADGFTYQKDGLTLVVTALANGSPTQLIQDITPENSGLAALSEDDDTQDQTQLDSGEALNFMFNTAVFLTNIEFNSGADRDCSAASQPEGPCGDFELFIDNVSQGMFTAIDLLTDVFFGTSFRFVASTPDAGFTIAQFEVSEVPVPAALPLLLSGLAGLGFAARRRKAA